MDILVIGNGAREHALAWKLRQSPKVGTLYIAPGNPGTAQIGTNVPINSDDVVKLAQFANDNHIGLTVVGPELPLTLGIVDEFKKRNLRCWGPSRAAAQLEGSKVAMKEFLRRHNIPTAAFKIFNKAADAHAYITEVDGPLVVKCDGLAAGKGVTVARTADEAHAAIDRIMIAHEFGQTAGRQVVIEEVLKGEEISVFAFCDGFNALLLDGVQDHKQVFDGDEGPNTGGMGAFSPVPGLMKSRDEDEMVRRIVVPTLSGLVHEGRPYIGLLYMGLMITDSGPKVIEYNVRFGDPECQALMLRLESDLVEIMEACIDGTLDTKNLEWKPGVGLCVTLASKGYPGKYPKDLAIGGLDNLGEAVVFHAGTRDKSRDKNKTAELVTDGGRVLTVCALGQTLDEARTIAYRACGAITFDGKHYRKDIGKRLEARKVNK